MEPAETKQKWYFHAYEHEWSPLQSITKVLKKPLRIYNLAKYVCKKELHFSSTYLIFEVRNFPKSILKCQEENFSVHMIIPGGALCDRSRVTLVQRKPYRRRKEAQCCGKRALKCGSRPLEVPNQQRKKERTSPLLLKIGQRNRREAESKLEEKCIPLMLTEMGTCFHAQSNRNHDVVLIYRGSLDWVMPESFKVSLGPQCIDGNKDLLVLRTVLVCMQKIHTPMVSC
jgi:hypothetical protein